MVIEFDFSAPNKRIATDDQVYLVADRLNDKWNNLAAVEVFRSNLVDLKSQITRAVI
jgi:hypothetical protein